MGAYSNKYGISKILCRFERLRLSVRSKLSSVRTALALCSKKNCHPFERLELSVQNNTLIQEKTRNWVEARPKGPWRLLPVKTNAFSKMFWAFIRSPNQNGTLHQDPCKRNKTKTNHKTVLLPCATTSVEIGRIIPTINFRPILKQE